MKVNSLQNLLKNYEMLEVWQSAFNISSDGVPMQNYVALFELNYIFKPNILKTLDRGMIASMMVQFAGGSNRPNEIGERPNLKAALGIQEDSEAERDSKCPDGRQRLRENALSPELEINAQNEFESIAFQTKQESGSKLLLTMVPMLERIEYFSNGPDHLVLSSLGNISAGRIGKYRKLLTSRRCPSIHAHPKWCIS